MVFLVKEATDLAEIQLYCLELLFTGYAFCLSFSIFLIKVLYMNVLLMLIMYFMNLSEYTRLIICHLVFVDQYGIETHLKDKLCCCLALQCCLKSTNRLKIITWVDDLVH